MHRGRGDVSELLPFLPAEVVERIGPYYVYILVDPTNDSIFYVGKGTGQRLLAHGYEAMLKADPGPRSSKVARIREIRAAGHEPRIDVVRHGLREDEALLVEAALIDCLAGLTNKVAGHGAAVGRTSLAELVRRYGATPIDPGASSVILVRLGPWKDDYEEIEPGTFRPGHGYREGMTPEEVAQSTRAWWANISPANIERRGIRHAVAVHDGVTRGVMVMGNWTRRGTRRAFAATPLTVGPVYDEWVGPLGRRVPFARGSQSPVTYWPPASLPTGHRTRANNRSRESVVSAQPSGPPETGETPPVDRRAPPAVLIRLGAWRDGVLEIEPGTHRTGAGYREGMPLSELVDATRAWWRISPERVNRAGICHAVAVHQGITRAAMVIGDWIPRSDGRWAFAATPLTEGPVHDAWVGPSGRRVDFSRGSQNPIAYWPPRPRTDQT